MIRNSQHDPEAREVKIVNDLSAGDRAFVQKLVKELHLNIWWDEFDEQDRNLVTLALPDPDDDEDDDEAAEEEGRKASERVLKKYLSAPVLTHEGFDEREDEKVQDNIRKWKNKYYHVSSTLIIIIEVIYEPFLSTGEARIQTPRPGKPG